MDFGTTEPNVECFEALELVALRDPDDVHVASLAINVAPSILVSDDKKAFNKEVKEALAKYKVEVMGFAELLKLLE
ncbi:hypothetical protein EYM_02270 [Ignicoccus islandicus DSM 13165]|uniref:PIN domain-containing protein n=1 Tax=Ignicoccus islandicus DSM 13165 TaxID=940295 RepID=A0A0U2VE41_9CREN|nr:hypothetical protein [Ignicoccus islandicus]ALU12306.1 hypothetical protein EYM_02270 [Ignicoccus islandicus DSM 13165]